ncbi:hypothetical protein V6N12_012412, partial [Hibiscus sabdariffa]
MELQHIGHEHPLVFIQHPIVASEEENEEYNCLGCGKPVEGCYCCSTSDCDYLAHVHCATDETIWGGTIVLEDTDERSKEELSESLNLITDIVEQRSVGELMVASEIKHAYHDHNLTLTFSGEIDGDSQCDGCMRPISTPSYSCDQCKFFLHKDCAELPRTMRHPFHKHLLTLTNSDFYLKCTGCRREYHGFSYRCCKNDCSQIVHPEVNFDLQCMLFSDTLKHPSHEHSLFLVHKFDGVCSGCLTGRYLWHNNIAY